MMKVTTTDNEGEAGRDEVDEGDVQGHDGEHPEVSNAPIPIPALLLPRGHAMGHNSSLTTFRASQHCRAARARPPVSPQGPQQLCGTTRAPCVAPTLLSTYCDRGVHCPENARTCSGGIYTLRDAQIAGARAEC